MIGYLLVQAMANELPGRDVVAVLTQVIVDAGDPAFTHPTKPAPRRRSRQAATARRG